jgi:hypothetical protein
MKRRTATALLRACAEELRLARNLVAWPYIDGSADAIAWQVLSRAALFAAGRVAALGFF